MKLVFKKEFDGDASKLPQREVEGAVQFREPDDIKKLSLIVNIIGCVLMAILFIPIVFLSGGFAAVYDNWLNLFGFFGAAVLSLAVSPVHEVLHASCFKGEVEFYTALKIGLLFVVGTESMTKARFVFMSMLPNLVFGFIPYALFFVFPSQFWLGCFGALCIGSGAGDYFNVFNALTQMPKGSLCYMSGMHSYWYMPKK